MAPNVEVFSELFCEIWPGLVDVEVGFDVDLFL